LSDTVYLNGPARSRTKCQPNTRRTDIDIAAQTNRGRTLFYHIDATVAML